MISVLVSALKIIFLLGFLIGIHETGHFLVAKKCKVRVNEFSIGFGPTIWKKQGEETLYALRLIPLGGYVSMEGESEHSDKEGSFTKASISKRIAIVVAGAGVNIIFAIIVYFILATIHFESFYNGIVSTGKFLLAILDSIGQLFVGKVSTDQLMGPVGISEIISKTSGLEEFIYMLALISISLGVTNLMPFPPLDGGKILFLIIEAIRRKPIKEETEIQIQLLGFALLIALSIYVTYHDIIRIL